MSQGRAIDPLPLEDFPSEQDTQDPGFESLFNDLVGDAATPADGFEDDVAVANGLLDALDGALTTLSGQDGGTLDDAFVEILSVDPTDAGEHVILLQAAIPAVEGNVDNLGNLLGGASTPAPPAGGGAGTGGLTVSDQTATVDQTKCGASVGWPPTNTVPLPYTQVVPVTNQSNSAVQIASVTLIQPHAGVFTATTDCTGALDPGATCNFKITQQTTEGTGAIFALELKLSTPNVTEYICFQLGLTGGGGAGGGGGGTGGGIGGGSIFG